MSDLPVLSKDLEKAAKGGLTKELKVQFEALAQKFNRGDSDFEDEDDSWEPTQLKMVHPTSDDAQMPPGAQPGELYHSGILVPRPMKFVVAYAYTARARFVPDVDIAPSCQAEKVDRKGRGTNDKSVSVYGDRCAECPYDAQPFRHGKPTDCNNQMNIIMIPEDLADIYSFRFAKTGWSAGVSLEEMAKATPGKPWYRYFQLSSELQPRATGSGKYAKPVVTPVDMEADPVPEYLKVFAEFVNTQVKAIRAEKRNLVVERVEAIAAQVQGSDSVDADYADTM